MRISCLVLLLVVLQCSVKNSCDYWEQFSMKERESILFSASTSNQERDFYFKKFEPSDDERTFSLLDLLTYNNNSSNTRALHFYLFNNIALNADGALAEVMGDYFVYWLKDNGAFVLRYLQDHPQLEKVYLLNIGSAFYFGDQPLRYDEFKQTVTDQLGPNELTYSIDFFHELESILISFQETECSYRFLG